MQGMGLFSILNKYTGVTARGIHKSLGNALGTVGRTAAYGAGVGGMYGAMSGDTSVIGGAMAGATLGLGGRYARAGFRGGMRTGGGVGFREAVGAYGRGFGQGIQRRAIADYKGVSMRSNIGFNKIRGLSRGWMGGV